MAMEIEPDVAGPTPVSRSIIPMVFPHIGINRYYPAREILDKDQSKSNIINGED